MSIDLVKSALYAALQADMPTLLLYPELIDTTSETWPNLAFIEIGTQNLDARPGLERLQIPNPDMTEGAAPYLVTPVIARRNTRLRVQLRDKLGDGDVDTEYQRIRDQHNAVDRFLTETRAIMVGPDGAQTLSEIWYEGNTPSYYPIANGIFLHEYDIRLENWRLLAANGIPTYAANQIAVDITRQRGSTLLIERLYTVP